MVDVSSVAGSCGMGSPLAYVGSKAALERTTPLRAVNEPEDIARDIVRLLGTRPT